MSSNAERIRRHEHEIGQQEKKAKDRHRAFVNRAIERGYDALSVGDWPAVAEVCAGLYNSTRIDSVSMEFYSTHKRIDEMPWSHEAVTQWLNTQTPERDPSAVADLAMRRSSYTELGEFLRDLFVSLETACVIDHHVKGEFENTQPVFGYELQLGERYVRPESPLSGPLNVRDANDEWKAVLFAGGTGSGKSTAEEAFVMDSYAAGRKIIDLIDWMKCENATYDIQQQPETNEELIRSRYDMGLSPGFSDMPEPEAEILVPLTRDLEEMQVPQPEDGDEPTVKPFTIPASELSYRQLVMLLHHTTDVQEQHLRSAHQKLDAEGRDWTLADLALEVEKDPSTTDKMAARIRNTLQTAQQKAFIRDTDCEHRLDWSEVMQTRDVISSFSVHTIREQSDRLLVMSYLIDSLAEARFESLRPGTETYPPLTVVLREMHKVAPQSKSGQSSESAQERFMIDTLEELFSVMRHADMEILADTQKFHRQLDSDISERFDQIFAFRGHVPDVSKILRTRTGDTDAAERIAQFPNPGMAALVDEDGLTYPIQFAPPPNHHLEAKEDGSGLEFRATALPDEELVESPWKITPPSRMKIADSDEPKPERFLMMNVLKTGDPDDVVLKEDLSEAYNDWASEQGCSTMTHKNFCSALWNSSLDVNKDDDEKQHGSEKKRAVKGIRLNYQSSSQTNHAPQSAD